MTYSDWNNIISNYFFNSGNAGKNVYLYLTKEELIKIGQRHLYGKTETEVLNNFINAIKYSQVSTSTSEAVSPIEQPLKLFNNWNKIDPPPFIAYLCLYIIPLTENFEDLFNSNNYYDKVNLFLFQYGIIDIKKIKEINSLSFRRISHLWDALEEWTIITKNCDLGIFELKKFGNTKWIYVGKPFSQCILPPKAINKLSELFYEAGLVPNSYYSKNEIKKIVLRHGMKTLMLKDSVLDFVRKSESNELGDSILDIVVREYSKWTGESHETSEEQAIHKTIRNFSVSRIFLQLKINEIDEDVKLTFRIYSSNEYPEDLKIGDFENIYELNGWSKVLSFPFKNTFELKDTFNKWLAKFPENNLRLFINAGNYQLSSAYWIETDLLSRTEPMYLLCNSSLSDSIKKWGKSFHPANFRVCNFSGIPENQSLFYIHKPNVSHPDIPNLKILSQKSIELVGGVKLKYRTYLNDYLPEVQIINGDGNEKVFIQYKNLEETKILSLKQSDLSKRIIPLDIKLNTEFIIKVENENLSGNQISYELVSSERTAEKILTTFLPKRDSFGKTIKESASQFCQGSNIINPMMSSKRFICPLASLFTSLNSDSNEELETPVYFQHSGNMFAAFLSAKGILTTEEFFSSFEYYFSKKVSPEFQNNQFNLTRIKKTSLQFYDYTGYLDYDYETSKIIVNPPQLIFIPSNKGRKVLLIGARDSYLAESLLNTAFNLGLQVDIKKQFPANEWLLLPDVITIKSYGDNNNGFGENSILQLARQLRIKFSNDYFPQYAFQEFSVNIYDYEHSLEETDPEDYGWARKVFNSDNLRYEINETKEINREFSLVEYKLNEYKYYNKLWKNGLCFKIDKNWGRYIALKHYNKNVILFDGQRKRVAIPLEMPLPRLFAESLMLFSGFAPDLLKVEERYYNVYENIPGLITETIFKKLGQQPINKELK
jgi:hypothetical protein